jgi:hypothetical protein
MATGIIVPNLLELAYSISTPILVNRLSASTRAEIQRYDWSNLATPGPWKPPQWSQPALTVISLPQTPEQIAQTQQAIEIAGDDTLAANTLAAAKNNYVFDAVIRASHRRVLKKTQHPVLSGANISDHAYMEPARLTLEIGMSDVMASFVTGHERWTGWGTKSVSAWRIMKQWMINRTLLTVQTRLDTYYNMLIEDCSTQDDNRTLHGLRATVVFGELIAATAESQSIVSARPQTSDDSPAGAIQGTPISPDQLSQHMIPSLAYPAAMPNPFVPGAGDVSSINLSALPVGGR